MSTPGMPDTTATPFGQWLSRQRKARDLTQEDLAERLGCSVWSIQKMEVGNRRPSRQVAELLAGFFGMAAEEREAFLLFARGQGEQPSWSQSSTTREVAEEQPEYLPPTPAPRSPSPQPHPHNLPVQLTSFVGRDAELPRVRDLMLTADVRLLTLTGPPGTGKTRLALQAAAELLKEFPDGVFFVNLAPITDPGLVMAEIAEVLDVRESGTTPVFEAVLMRIAARRLLLVLDNFEQVLEAAPAVGQLLVQAPALKVLVTSRVPLHIRGEKEFSVPPLHLPEIQRVPPPPLDRLKRYEAVRLFVERARDVSEGFEMTEDNALSIAEICCRLDGLPLAIELAAARIKFFPPQVLLARLQDMLKVLTGGPHDLPARQQTIRNAIEWSYQLLEEGEKKLFDRLGVFVGGFTVEASEAVCNAAGDLGVEVEAGLISLADKSLLHRVAGVGDEPRFAMLEMVREYAVERLREREAWDRINDLHFDYFLNFAEEAERETLGNEADLWFRRLDAEQDNLRSALEWGVSQSERVEQGLRLAGALRRYWFSRGYLSEGRQWCTRLLKEAESRPGGARPSPGRVKALNAQARMILEQGDFAEARPIFEKSVAVARALGDDAILAAALGGLGMVSLWQGEYRLSQSLYEECLAIARRLGKKDTISDILSSLGTIHMLREEHQAAQARYEEALAIDRDRGNLVGIASTLTGQGWVVFQLGDNARARTLIEESLGIARHLGVHWIIASCLARLGMIALRQGEPQQAEAYLREGLVRAGSTGNRRWSRWYLIGLAEVARLAGMTERAAKLTGASDGALSAAGGHYDPVMHSEIDRIIAAVRQALDKDTFERLCAEARVGSPQESLDFALEPIPEELLASAQASASPAHVTGESRAQPGAKTEGEDAAIDLIDSLTAREVEVLRLVAEGLPNREIADRLIITEGTVKWYVSQITSKLGAKNRTQAVARARELGLPI